MAATTLDRSPAAAPEGAGPQRSTTDRVAKVLFALLCVATLAGALALPTYPNYDSYYSLLWARELLDGGLPQFEEFRAPTQHPLAILFAIPLTLIGEEGDRAWILLTFASFLVLVAGVYALAKHAFTPLVGLAAGALLVSRFDFPFLAARGYIDVPYMALVVWAAVLEARRPRRGLGVFVLLALAGTLRPEAWLLAAAYWLWLQLDRSAPLKKRLGWTALAALGPLVWAATDFAVTGDPLFSLTYTSGSAEDLGRSRTLGELPSAVPGFFENLVKLPVLLGAVLGIVLAIAITPKRATVPLLLLLSGVATFFAIGIAGLSVIERYLIVGALALLVFAGVAFGGFTLLRPGKVRTAWMVLAILGAAGAVSYSAFRVNPDRFVNELRLRGDAHDSLSAVLRDADVVACLEQGRPLTFPNHKLLPDGRFIADLPADRVQARAAEFAKPDAERGLPAAPKRTGVAVVVTGRAAIFKQAFTDKRDPPSIQVPPAGFDLVAVTPYYAAYARGC